jgi:hypothetical protein
MNRYYLKGFAIYILIAFANLNAMEVKKEEKAKVVPSATTIENLFKYVRKCDIQGVKRLIAENFPLNILNIKDEFGQSVFHHAVGLQCYNMLKFLLERDEIDPNEPDHTRTTPLHLAVQLELPEMVEILVNSGKVDKTIKDYRGFTAQDYAKQLEKIKPIAHTYFSEGQRREEESRIRLGRKQMVELLSK